MKQLHFRARRSVVEEHNRHRRTAFSALLMAPLVVGCAASFPPPTQRLIDAQSAERSAQELGAADEPKAQLSLKRARDQIAAAEKAIADGENRTADALLVRAHADAELALAQARETDAQLSLKQAKDESAQQKRVNEGQGAVQ